MRSFIRSIASRPGSVRPHERSPTAATISPISISTQFWLMKVEIPSTIWVIIGSSASSSVKKPMNRGTT